MTQLYMKQEIEVFKKGLLIHNNNIAWGYCFLYMPTWFLKQEFSCTYKYENILQNLINLLCHMLYHICVVVYNTKTEWKCAPWLPDTFVVIQMYQIDGLVQERCNSSALAMELCLS